MGTQEDCVLPFGGVPPPLTGEGRLMHTGLSDSARSHVSTGVTKAGCEDSAHHKDRDPVVTCSGLAGPPAGGSR